MNPKALMFGLLGLFIFGGLTMMWVGHDMNNIHAEEKAKLTSDCRAAQAAAMSATTAPANAAAGATAAGSVAATAPVTDAAPIADDKLLAKCAKIGMRIQAPDASATGQVPANASANVTQPPADTGTQLDTSIANGGDSPAPTQNVPNANSAAPTGTQMTPAEVPKETAAPPTITPQPTDVRPQVPGVNADGSVTSIPLVLS